MYKPAKAKVLAQTFIITKIILLRGKIGLNLLKFSVCDFSEQKSETAKLHLSSYWSIV